MVDASDPDAPDYVLTPDDALRSARTVWTLLLVSMPVYALAAIAWPIPEGWEAAEHASWTVVGIFAGLGTVTLAAVPLMRRWLFFGPRDRGELQEDPQEYLGALRTMSAATWAMATSLAIYGLFAYFAVFQLWVFALFFIPAGALFFIFRPPVELVHEVRPSSPYEQ